MNIEMAITQDQKYSFFLPSPGFTSMVGIIPSGVCRWAFRRSSADLYGLCMVNWLLQAVLQLLWKELLTVLLLPELVENFWNRKDRFLDMGFSFHAPDSNAFQVYVKWDYMGRLNQCLIHSIHMEIETFFLFDEYCF
jgi:hypothetical protein